MDEPAEYQIQDRLTFMRFLGLGLGDRTHRAPQSYSAVKYVEGYVIQMALAEGIL